MTLKLSTILDVWNSNLRIDDLPLLLFLMATTGLSIIWLLAALIYWIRDKSANHYKQLKLTLWIFGILAFSLFIAIVSGM